MPVSPARSAALIAIAALVALPAVAQVSGHEWHKTYTVSGNASLTIETGDTALEIQPCGACKEIRVQVQSDRDLNDYHLEEHQDSDHVFFSLKEKPHLGFHMNWKTEHTKVTVETPARLDLDAKTADGNLAARGLTGDLKVHSGDGSVMLEDVHGNLRLGSSDGNVTIRRATGTLEARGSDGHMTVDGEFTAVQMHTSDGNLDLTLAPGSKLDTASSVESSDGHVSINLPSTLAADLDISTSDGKIDCSLPLTMDHYDSSHAIRGKMNGGGTPLSIHTSDGNVRIAAI
jgi:DUF4097 and DUF4098 domain-containing protein YvlB